MKIVFSLLLIAILCVACDDSRVYEKNLDFEHKAWMAGHKPEFEFAISDTAKQYNLYCDLRNSVAYPYSRIFFTYYLQDSIGLVLSKKLIGYTLFDPKTGKPEGSSALGDIYDHRILLLKDHKFPYAGMHKIKFEQFMRKDTLEGIFAVGVRVENAMKDPGK
jgi:gliding motility-associated lipoprotein GldH